MHYGNLHVMTHFEVTWQGQRSLEVKLWEPSRYDAFRGHMTRSKVIGGQIVNIVILLTLLFPEEPEGTIVVQSV